MDTSQLEVIRQHIEDITADVDVWADRKEPDSRARRYASAAVDAIDSALSELQAIRARLVAEIRTADDQAAARADALLADTDAMLAGPPPELMAEFRQATGRAPAPIRLDGCTCAAIAGSHKPPCQWAERAPSGLMPQWDTPPALRGYGYTLPEDYLRGGAQ